jgi:hypothetical protein
MRESAVINNTALKNLVLRMSLILGALIVGLLLSGLLLEPSMPLVVALFLPPIIILFFVKPRVPIFLLLLSIMFTEFYWVKIMGGYLKPFHVASVLLFITFSLFHLRVLKHSKIFWLLVLFVACSLISIAFSGDWENSLRSFLLPLVLFSIALNIGIALHTGKISEETFIKVISFGSLVNVIFGLLQMAAYSLAGVLLTLTENQIGQIVTARRPPAFFTEADTFGKFLGLPLMLLLPFVIDKTHRLHRSLKMLWVVLLLGFFVNMTRSALLGIGLAGTAYVFYLFKTKSLSRNLAIIFSLLIMFMASGPFIFGMTGAVGSREELNYRFQSLMNPTSAMSQDQSISYRKRGVEETIEGSVESLDAFIIGHGWGSSIVTSRGEPKDVGGSIFINTLYYSGILALIVFLLLCFRIIVISLKLAKVEDDQKRHIFAEGIFLSFAAMIVTSQLASMWIAPEFWVVIGCAIYLELAYNLKDENSLNP